ncbi:MAG: primosomal protein N' [Elusimicrobia bacterium RIFOXYA2_FULL_39_19]|nr:MAG: primosomal protein N' [Elusimicrobia bacterium RIFOXYA2_FULL_39_19]
MIAEIAFPIPVERNFSYKIPGHLTAYAKPGMRVMASFGPRKQIGYIVKITADSQLSNLKELDRLIDQSPIITENLFKLASRLSFTCMCTLGEALNCIFPVSSKTKEFSSNPGTNTVSLNTTASAVLPQKFITALKDGKTETFIVTESKIKDRINIYTSMIKEALPFGQCIYLVPEIMLVEDTVLHLREFFGNVVAPWHSHISYTEKYTTWKNALEGKTKIIVGTRSAVFMPFSNLKLVIIDDESDHSYKNPQKPLYDAISTAIEYVKYSGGVTVLGGDIISLNSFYNMQNKAFINLTGIKNEPPEIVVSEVNKKDQSITNDLKKLLEQRLLKNELSIIFVNRRGYSSMVYCFDCKSILRCSKCKIPLAYHTDIKMLKCHYCGIQYQFIDRCIKCRGYNMKFLGIGTERIESTIKMLLPPAKIFRADHDTLKKPGAIDNLIENIKQDKIDIIVATQIILPIIEKISLSGFKKLTLIAINNIDDILYQQDFRATERTFQMIYKMSNSLPPEGAVFIQTADKTHYIFKYFNKLNWKGFYKTELSYRQELDYPPYKELINIIIRGKDKLKTASEAVRLKDYLTQALAEKAEILGPDEPPHAILRGEHRQHILLKLSKDDLLFVSDNIKNFKIKPGHHILFDLNPYSIV